MSGTRTSVRRGERSLRVLMHIPVAVEAMAGAVKVVATLVVVCAEAMDMAVRGAVETMDTMVAIMPMEAMEDIVHR